MKLLLILLALIAPSIFAQGARPDTAPSVDEAVTDLLERMTIEEKVGQMTQVNLSRLMGSGEWDRGALNEGWLETILSDLHVGSLLSGGGAAPVPNTPTQWAETVNELQRYAIENTRLGIPIIYGVDAVHGHNNVVGATIYPHNIGLAATWNPDLVERVARRTAEDVRATGIHWNFSPVADLARDPRWGRFYETFGEDVLLASELVAASVRGLQGEGLETRVAATIKHFIGYSQPLTGRDRSPAFVSTRTLRDTFLPPFKAGFAADAATVMVNSGSFNGIPVHASRYLLTDLLRDDLGFEGVVVSDWEDILKLQRDHGVAATFADAVAMSINAGVDMYMVPHDAEGFVTTLLELVEDGTVSEARIDEAVRRILTLKYALDLFDNPYVDADAAAAIVEEDRTLAYEAAVASLTLLENDGILPFNDGILPFNDDVQTLLVLGEGADSLTRQMGGWTIGWQGIENSREVPPGVTVLEGIRAAAPDGLEIVYLPSNANAERLQEALAAADAVVLVLGEEPYAEGQGDALELRLPQEGLLETVLEAGTPTVLVLLAGRPLILPEDAFRSPAFAGFLMAYLPGSEGGSAIADVLFGHADPSGRLPFSWPHRVGDLPLSYDALHSEVETETLYPFGYGLGYSRTRTRNLRAEREDEEVTLQVDVQNLGERAVLETLQVYVERPPTGVVTPVRQLVGFEGVRLEPDTSETVTIRVPLERLMVIGGDVLGDGDWILPEGVYRFRVGDVQTTLRLP